jgi:hypothetical protein
MTAGLALRCAHCHQAAWVHLIARNLGTLACCCYQLAPQVLLQVICRSQCVCCCSLLLARQAHGTGDHLDLTRPWTRACMADMVVCDQSGFTDDHSGGWATH